MFVGKKVKRGKAREQLKLPKSHRVTVGSRKEGPCLGRQERGGWAHTENLHQVNCVLTAGPTYCFYYQTRPFGFPSQNLLEQVSTINSLVHVSSSCSLVSCNGYLGMRPYPEWISSGPPPLTLSLFLPIIPPNKRLFFSSLFPPFCFPLIF